MRKSLGSRLCLQIRDIMDKVYPLGMDLIKPICAEGLARNAMSSVMCTLWENKKEK